MKPCPVCRRASAAGAAFCAHCGYHFTTGARPDVRAVIPRRRGLPVWAIVALVTVVLGGLGLATVAIVVVSLLGSQAGGTSPHHLAYTQTATGDAETKPFTVGDAWDLTWHYDCPANHNGNFSIIIEKDGSMTSELGPNENGHSNYGTSHLTGGAGSRTLQVVSSCHWTVVAYSN